MIAMPKVDHVTLTEDEFLDTFEPLDGPEETWVMDHADLREILSDFSEEEIAHHVWTYVEGDHGTYVIDGAHYVNRIGYVITAHPAVPMTNYEVLIDEYEPEEDDD